MKFYEFSLLLSGEVEITEDLANRLFEAGCDDATPSSVGSSAEIDFTREAETLEKAIQSAIADVTSAGFKVARAEIQADLMEPAL